MFCVVSRLCCISCVSVLHIVLFVCYLFCCSRLARGERPQEAAELPLLAAAEEGRRRPVLDALGRLQGALAAARVETRVELQVDHGQPHFLEDPRAAVKPLGLRQRLRKLGPAERAEYRRVRGPELQEACREAGKVQLLAARASGQALLLLRQQVLQRLAHGAEEAADLVELS